VMPLVAWTCAACITCCCIGWTRGSSRPTGRRRSRGGRGFDPATC
jgi:hypothetical protein